MSRKYFMILIFYNSSHNALESLILHYGLHLDSRSSTTIIGTKHEVFYRPCQHWRHQHTNRSDNDTLFTTPKVATSKYKFFGTYWIKYFLVSEKCIPSIFSNLQGKKLIFHKGVRIERVVRIGRHLSKHTILPIQNTTILWHLPKWITTSSKFWTIYALFSTTFLFNKGGNTSLPLNVGPLAPDWRERGHVKNNCTYKIKKPKFPGKKSKRQCGKERARTG